MRPASRVALAVSVLVAAGCTGSSRAPAASPSGAPGPATTAKPSSPPAMPRLVLTADLTERASRWSRVAFLPFGVLASQLGFKRLPESTNSQPSSFAVAPDGSFWIDDRWKARIAHYSPAGRFLGAVGPIQERGEDVVVWGDRVVVLAVQGGLHGGAEVLVSEPGGAFSRAVINDNGRPLFVADLLASAQDVLGEVAGFAGDVNAIGEGPKGIARLDVPGTGQAHLLPGLPLEGGTFFTLSTAQGLGGGDQDFNLSFSRGDRTDTRPLRVNVLAKDGRSRLIPAEVGPGEQTASADDVFMYVEIAPTRAADAERSGGGRWLLRVGESPVLWERLPDPGIPDERQRKHIAVGPGGAVYLMVAQRDGMAILRRT